MERRMKSITTRQLALSFRISGPKSTSITHRNIARQTKIPSPSPTQHTSATTTMSLSQDHLRTLDTLRMRLSQLNTTLTSIHSEILRHDPLPAWPQVASLRTSLAFVLSQLNDTMTLNATTLKEAHVYPMPSFPGHKDSNMITQLLRKKLDVGTEEWIAELTTGEKAKGLESGGLQRDELEELWGWTRGASTGIVGAMLDNDDFGDDFTLAEKEEGIENVRTGLRRKMWDEEGGSDDEDEDKMEEDIKPVQKEQMEEGVDPELKILPLDGVLRFLTTGAVPQRPNR